MKNSKTPVTDQHLGKLLSLILGISRAQQPNKLTPLDVAKGYQCDSCADRDEGRIYD